jgi:hypothetical protein
VRIGYYSLVLASWGVCAWIVGYFVSRTARSPVPAGTQVGRWYGLIGAGLFVLLTLYGLRRIIHRGRLGALQGWYRAHILLGVVALVVTGCHCGFALRSPLLTALQAGFWGTVLTGLLGWAWQTLLKRSMARHEHRPAVLKELEVSRAELQDRLALMVEAAEPVEGIAYHTEEVISRAVRETARLRATHLWRMPDWGFWESRLDEAFAGKGFSGLPEGAREAIRELNRVEVLRSYHRLLRGWTTLHLLFTALAVQMIAWHVVTVAFYPR